MDIYLDIAVALSCAAGGAMCGWITHAVGVFAPQRSDVVRSIRESPGHDPEPVVAEPELAHEELLAEVADRLKSHAAKMSENVDAHQSRVRDINDQLTGGGEVRPEDLADLVHQVLESNTQMQRQLETAQDQIHQQTLELESAHRRADTDALTKIPNRGAFDSHIETRFRVGPFTIPEVPHAGTLALLDVDHFKKFNDVYGHLAGDEVLRVVAGVLHAKLNGYGQVARYGGEEFAIVFDGMTAEDAAPIADAVRAAIAVRGIEFEDQLLHVTASMGLACLRDGETVAGWIERADQALYKSKEAGRDCAHRMSENEAVRIEASSGTDQAKADSVDAEAAGSGEWDYLPDRESLETTLEQLRAKAGSDLQVSVVAIRCESALPPDLRRSMLPIVRSGLRSVDRLGVMDGNTLLVLLPSIEKSTARQNANRMIESLRAVRPEDPPHMAASVAEVCDGESFSELTDFLSEQLA